jgi:hypothetical protein
MLWELRVDLALFIDAGKITAATPVEYATT